MMFNLLLSLRSLPRFNMRITLKMIFSIGKLWASFCKRDIKFGEILRRLGNHISSNFNEDFTFKISIYDKGFRARSNKLVIVNYIREADLLPRF